MNRTTWLIALWVYALAASADVAVHLSQHRPPEHGRLSANLAVAVTAGLFWPIDLVAQRLLAS